MIFVGYLEQKHWTISAMTNPSSHRIRDIREIFNPGYTVPVRALVYDLGLRHGPRSLSAGFGTWSYH